MSNDELRTTYEDERGNRVLAYEDHPKLTVEFKDQAHNCTLTIGKDTKAVGFVSFRRPNGSIDIGPRCNLAGVQMLIGNDSHINIGEHTFIGPSSELSTAEGATLNLGRDSLFGAYNIMRSDDAHPFYDLNTGHRLNKAKSTTIADRVWTGRGVTVLPGAHIETGSIIGAQTVVTASRTIPAHCVAVGNPARVVRTRVKWLYTHVQHNEVPGSIEAVPEPVIVPQPRVSLYRRVRRIAGRVKRAVLQAN